MKLHVFHIWIATVFVGLVFIMYSGVLAFGDTKPVGVFSLLMGCIFVVAGLIGVKFEDEAFAARQTDSGEGKSSGEFWSGLWGSMRELFLGPKSGGR